MTATSKLVFLLFFIGLPILIGLVDVLLVTFSFEALILAMFLFGLGLVLMPLFFDAEE